jgi:putative restriction endonuclease
LQPKSLLENYVAVRFFVAITDSDWFDYLSALAPDEVNFWQPSGSSQFQSLSPGEPLLFKLHSPDNYIVGGGFFSHFSILPATFAWAAFGEKNGAATEYDMRRRIERYRRGSQPQDRDYLIGCILLQQPFFFDRNSWIPVTDWPKPTVRGKGFNTDDAAGRKLWEQVQARLSGSTLHPVAPIATARFGQPQIVLPRLGQGAFRVIVTDSYERQCAVTSSHVLHVLEAAHIRPYSQGGTHSPENGILLRQDVHTLFDKGYITVTPDYRVTVSRRIKEEFDNGKDYYALAGMPINTPFAAHAKPSPELLTWHNEKVFRH